MTVSILIPYRYVDEQRERIFKWVMGRWMTDREGWEEPVEVVVGHHPVDGPWRKGLAYSDALSRARGEIVVFTDADVWIPRLPAAVKMLTREEAGWVRGCDEVMRLGHAATETVLEGGAEPSDAYLVRGGDEPTYTHDAAGAGTVVWRKDADAIPVDQRFEGWGHEDSAFGFALSTLVGDSGWMNGSPCYHLWHMPQERLSRTRGSDISWRLWRRYQKAYGLRPQMQEIVNEAKALAASDPTR